MTTRLIFLCAGATASSRVGAFPTPDEGLDDGGRRKTAAFRLRGGFPERVLSCPSRAAKETATTLGLTASIEPPLADRDCGTWCGRPLTDFESTEAAALMAWIGDPSTAPPGGETLADLAGRVGRWIDQCVGTAPAILAISHAAVMRAAIAHVLAIPPAATLLIDIAPLSTLDLSHHGRWRLRELRRSR